MGKISVAIMRVLSLCNQFADHCRAKISPVAYARKIGVSVGKGVRIFSLHPGAFGSEPYLISIGDNVIITAGVRFITHEGSVFLFREEFPKLDVMGPISVGANTFIGMNAIIMPGVSIGNNCIVGAMSLVTKNVPDGSVVGGNPAKIIMEVKELRDKLLLLSCETGQLDPIEKQRELIQREFVSDSSGRRWLQKKR